MCGKNLTLPPPQFNLTEVSDTIACAHQFRELVVREGPAILLIFEKDDGCFIFVGEGCV